MARSLSALFVASCIAGTLSLGGCASRTVRVEVAPAPAVSLPSSTVAVVAADRECRPMADALIRSLGQRASIAVDPRADTRLLVFGCGLDIGWTLTEEIDATGDRPQSRQRADLSGRGHAVVAITDAHGTQAHILGSSRDGAVGAWGLQDMFRNRRALRNRLTESVAEDLVGQLNPTTRQIARRVYPNATEGSARELHTRAVVAEQRGDLDEALRLARASLTERPTERAAAYLRALERRVVAPQARASAGPTAAPPSR